MPASYPLKSEITNTQIMYLVCCNTYEYDKSNSVSVNA